MVMAQMKFRFALLVVLFVSLILFANTNVAQAQWAAISSGYGVTTNVHGLIVSPTQPLTAWAGTTDHSVSTVQFQWIDPDGNSVAAWHQNVDISSATWYTTSDVPPDADLPQEIIDWADANPGVKIRYAKSDTHIPEDEYDGTIIGDWTVKVYFHGAGGKIQCKDEATVAIRATSFVIDEVPFGTIVALLIPFGFLSIYAMKKKRSILM